MNIFEAIKQETTRYADQTAVVEGEERISYTQLIRATEQVALSLGQQGVARFHRVGLLCDDSIDYIVASLAILSLSKRCLTGSIWICWLPSRDYARVKFRNGCRLPDSGKKSLTSSGERSKSSHRPVITRLIRRLSASAPEQPGRAKESCCRTRRSWRGPMPRTGGCR